MPVAETLRGRQWDRCGWPGCEAAKVAPAGRCVAHLEGPELSAWLAALGAGAPFDARGATVGPALIERVVAALPRGDDGRPRLRRARFDAAVFPEGARFSDVVFEHEVCFDGATFGGSVSFERAGFEGHARFGRARFDDEVAFAGAGFDGQAWFAGSHFAADASFDEATFQGPAWFGGAHFAADASFARARFAADASFDRARFGCHAAFPEAVFLGAARYEEAVFARAARYDGARFAGPGGAPAGAVRRMDWSGAELAPWHRRVAATLFDAAVPVGLGVAAFPVALGLEALRYEGVRVPLVVAALAAGLGFWVRDVAGQGRTGQTLGKRRLGLSVVRVSDGTPPGAARSLARFLLHLLDAIPAGAGLLWPLWDRRRQTFADKLASTVVVLRSGWVGEAVEGAGRGAGGFS